MKQSVSKGQNFYLQVWFDAPHSPWEVIPGNWTNWYKSPSSRSAVKENKAYKYATMVFLYCIFRRLFSNYVFAQGQFSRFEYWNVEAGCVRFGR